MGGTAQLDFNIDQSQVIDGYSNSSVAVAVEGITYKNTSGNEVNGFVIAQKHSGTDGTYSWEDWELIYTDSSGKIDDDMRTWSSSIKDKEELFGSDASQADLDLDGYLGLSVDSLLDIKITDSDGNEKISDSTGDLLKTDSNNALYIIDDKDNSIIPIVDQWGGAPSFTFSESGGSGVWPIPMNEIQ